MVFFPQAVDKTIQLLGSETPHGPILLAWAVVRQLCLDDDRGNITRKMGNMALQLGVFPFLAELLDREPFSGSSVSYNTGYMGGHLRVPGRATRQRTIQWELSKL